MTVAAVVRSAIAARIRMKIDGNRLVLSALERPNQGLLEELRRAKPEVVEYLRSLAAWTDDDWQALFDERAGIIEFDGGLQRAEAEELAREEVAALRSLVEDSRNG